MTLIGFIGGVILLRSLFQQYVHGLSRMAETLRLMLGANRNFRVTAEGPPEVCDLARAANDSGQAAQRVARRRRGPDPSGQGHGRGRKEPARRADVRTGVGGRGVQPRRPHPALQQPRPAPVQGPGAGADLDERRRPDRTGRSIFSILERGQITHSLENIQQRLRKGSAEPTANFITTTRGGQLLRCQMAPVLRTGATAQQLPFRTTFPPAPFPGKGVTRSGRLRLLNWKRRRSPAMNCR
jgi:DNA polymerase-3 subunit epsilon